MFTWKQFEEQFRQIIIATIRFVKARRREASLNAAAGGGSLTFSPAM